jgi:hypothetical protein
VCKPVSAVYLSSCVDVIAARATKQEHLEAKMHLQTDGAKTRGRSGSGATLGSPCLAPSSRANALAAAVAACLALAAACQPADRSGTVQASIFAFDPQTRTYGLRRVAVDHLTSLVRLLGRDFSVRSDSRLYSGIGNLEIDRGSDFALEFDLEPDGTVVPADQQSMYALSLYRNLDLAASTLREHGHVPLRPLDVFYFPRMDSLLGDLRASFVDNAAYAPNIPGLLIVPSMMFGDLPMPLNLGIFAHELGHSVVQEEIFGDPKQSPGLAGDRAYSAMNEGVADLFGFAVTGDPDFTRPSIDLTRTAKSRDLSVPETYTEADLNELMGIGPSFDPHRHGSVMARAIYEMWPKLPDGTVSDAERGRLIDVILSSLRDPRVKAPSMATFSDAVASQLQGSERTRACAVLRMRLAPLAAQLTSCRGL